ncbi:MAG: ECF transporter S component [Defluviitaleaceae bacterium]|nr:ECF transporter S component [Defluviitaleaceae bacterium]
MLAAISSVLMFLEFPMPLFPSFLKLDFSDLPALIGAFSMGPVAGLAIEMVKNLIHLTRTQSNGIGELANFLVGIALVMPAGLIYRHKKTRSGAVYGMIAGAVAMALVAALANYFILIPFYTTFMPLDAIIAMCAAIIPAIDSLGKVILLSIVPFNLFKAVVVCLVTFLVYKRLSRLMKI